MAHGTPQEIAWAAGIFEGEGTFHVSERGKRINLKAAVAMSDQDVVHRFGAVLGFGVLAPWRDANRAHPGWKSMYEWRVQNFEHVQAVVALFWPWLGVRRKARAREVLAVARLHGWLGAYCKRGHERTEANTRWEPNSRVLNGLSRRCLDCRSTTDAARYQRTKV